MLSLMSFRNPIEIKINDGKKERGIKLEYMLNHYNEYLSFKNDQ